MIKWDKEIASFRSKFHEASVVYYDVAISNNIIIIIVKLHNPVMSAVISTFCGLLAISSVAPLLIKYL